MKYLHRFFILMISAAGALSAVSAVPDGYYDSCKGKTGQALLRELYSTISNHTNVGYDGLWSVYKESDVRDDGTLWDIYSTKRWPANFTKCGNYKVVGDCVNREHSFPKSWWGGGKSTQYSDAFHLYPTDGKVNGQRSSYPLGECSGGTTLPSNGSVKPLGRLGSCTYPGFSGTVFEPDDEYKGDLARSYFYMAACYNGAISGWTSGNGHDMLAGNSYPVYKAWAVEMLLKWAHQDMVSKKETDRNEAIYKHQKNRNPFIDYPELVDYIWGDKVGTPWQPGGDVEPTFEAPAAGSVIDFGKAAAGLSRSKEVNVKASNLTYDVTVTAVGAFSVSPSRLTAAQANAGANINVTVFSADAGSASGILLLKSGSLTRQVTLTAEIVDGLPVTISDLSPESFTVNWVNISDNTSAQYTLDVRCGDESVDGYPVGVPASAEQYAVTGLEPSTDYTVTFTGLPAGVSVQPVPVRTPDPVPYLEVLFDGELDFDAEPGVASEIAELLVDAENIEGDITVAVDAPFEISSDKAEWTQSLILAPDEDRFYMRVGPTAAGDYSTSITLSAGSYVNDNPTASASVAEHVDFIETWTTTDDLTKDVPCYSSTSFAGSACRWVVANAGFGTSSSDKVIDGTLALRLGKDSNSSLAMNENKSRGIGTVSFGAAKWGSDATAVVDVQYSTDGISWQTVKTVEIESADAATFTVAVNRTGEGRIRFQQTAGSRWLLDNISISDFTELGAVSELEYHSWDAYCRGGRLIIESGDSSRRISVYGLDGMTYFNDVVAGSATTLDLPAGLYIVTDGSFSRRVMVK